MINFAPSFLHLLTEVAKCNQWMKTTANIHKLLCEKDFLLLVNEVSKMSLWKVITDISGMFPQYFDFNSQLRPYALGGSVAEWLGRRTRNPEVTGSSPALTT